MMKWMITIISVLIISAAVFAQSSKQTSTFSANADRWIENVNTDVALSEDQIYDFKDIIVEYQTRRSLINTNEDAAALSRLQEETDKRFNEVLNDIQRNTWSSSRSGWWNNINSDLRNSPLPKAD